MFSTVVSLAHIAQGLCAPFAVPNDYSQEDWHARISALTLITELLSFHISEFPFFQTSCNDFSLLSPAEAVDLTHQFREFELETPVRNLLLNDSEYQPLIDYHNVLRGTTKSQDVVNMFRGVISVEKLAISTCSLAITKYELPLSVFTMFLDVIRDECLHLLALSRLIDVEPLFDGWIAEKRKPAWDQVLQCQTSLEHVLLEHCLFEGEGSISANYAVSLAKQLGFPDVALSVIARIATEEMRHATVGYQMAGILARNDSERHRAVERSLSLLRVIEPLEDPTSIKGKKQQFAESVIRGYAQDGDWMRATNLIVEESIRYAS